MKQVFAPRRNQSVTGEKVRATYVWPMGFDVGIQKNSILDVVVEKRRCFVATKT